MHYMAPKKPTPSPDVQEALALMQEGRVRGHRRRSPIVIWMQKNRAALERGFAETAPSWGKLATYLGDHGILDGDGKRPTAEATRQAWYRTKSMAPLEDRPATVPVAPSSAAQMPQAAVIPAPTVDPAKGAQSARPDPAGDDAEPPRRTFGNVKLRGVDRAPKAPVSPAPSPPANAEPPTPDAPTVNVDDVLAQFAPGITRR